MTPRNEIDTRIGQARLEEQMKHLEKTMSEGFKRIEHALLSGDSKSERLEERTKNLEHHVGNCASRDELEIERKRIDRIFWVWGAAVFIGSPVLALVTKLVMNHFGI